MKFYYKDKLVRTSKNHHYTHAVIRETEKGFGVVSCASRRDLAEKAMAKEIGWFEGQVKGIKLHIAAIENGKKEYYRDGRYFKVSPERYDELKRYLEENAEIVKNMKATMKIVELEER